MFSAVCLFVVLFFIIFKCSACTCIYLLTREGVGSISRRKICTSKIVCSRFSEESQRFYDGCLDLANQFGRIRDMATVHIAIGSMYTNAKVSISFTRLCFDCMT